MRSKVGVVPWLLVSPALALAFAGCAARAPETSVAFLSVGQGDCTILQQGSEAILIDAGPKTDGFDAGERIVRRRLRERGVTRLRGILLTHDDLDHTGGAATLLSAHPEAVAWIGPGSRIPLGARVQRLDPAGRMTFGAFVLAWRFPDSTAAADNARSALTLVEAGKMRFALTGDAPTGIEEGVANLAQGTVDVYKAGHHGSKSSGGADLLEALRPRFVVVSSGVGNRYGHPHPDALARFEAAGARTLRTDREGDVEFRFDGKAWELVTTGLHPTLR